jgi:hypothetical protein
VIPRAALLLGGVGALVLAFPGPTVGGVALTVIGLAALAVSILTPDSAAPALVIGAAAADWLLRGTSGGLLRLTALALALAVVHFSAALGAFTPWRSWVDRGVLLRWAVGCAAATAGGVLIVAATGILPATPAPAWTAAVAALALAGAALTGRLLGSPRTDPAAGKPADQGAPREPSG